VRFSDEHEVDVIVVQHVLRRFKPAVSADEIVHCKQLNVAELVHHANVEHLSAATIVLRSLSFAHLLGCSVRVPVDRLEYTEDEAQQFER